MLSAEPAILFRFQAVGVILLVFNGVVVSLLALVAAKGDFYSHCRHLLNYLPPCTSAAIKI